jgi:hypothetical protein
LRDAALGLQLVCDFTNPIIPPFRELRAAVIENGMPFGGDIGQALCLQPRGNFAPDVIVDLVGRRPLKELLPELFLGGGLNGLRIPMKPDAYSKVKPDIYSVFIPDSVPI